MSMKRILGTMLASRMLGRGGSRGALGTASALGMLTSLGRRRTGGTGSKMGLAALGYIAYQAYQGRQSNQTPQQHSQKPGVRGGNTEGNGDGLMDKLRDAANDFLGGGEAGTADEDHNSINRNLQEGEAAAERFSEDEALLMIRAMITAAYSDGAMSHEERKRILQAIGSADATAAERQIIEGEIAHPKSLSTLLEMVNDQETAQEFYLASRAALDGSSLADRTYLVTLRNTLGLSPEEAAEADSIAS